MNRRVQELMLPLDDYAVVPLDSTLKEAMQAMEDAQRRLPPGRQPVRAVLVKDRFGRIIGKIGHLSLLRALEPKYNALGDVERLASSGVNVELINLMLESYRFWRDDDEALRRRAETTKVQDAMQPASQAIDENAGLGEAVHRLIMWQCLSLLVTRDDQPVGVLRLSDLVDEICRMVLSPSEPPPQPPAP